MKTAIQIAAELCEPFAADEVRWKPQSVKGNRALAICYLDARAVMDRLDGVVGVGGWQDSYKALAVGNVLCKLRVKVEGEWIEHQDIGGASDQPDAGDKCKAAFSDALKRVAVKLGVGRYLYRLPHQWVDYDAQKKAFVRLPTLPAWALPKPPPSQAKEPAAIHPPKINGLKGPEIAAELGRLIKDAGADTVKFLDHFGCVDLASFPASRLAEARAQLQTKIDKKKQPS